MKRVDLNCDMGELPEMIADGTQEALLPFLTSVNIACGGHAGNEETMRATIEQALRRGVAIGAHPGYADRANFGRIALKLTAKEVADSVYEQLRAFGQVAETRGARVVQVKPHGALYNEAAKDWRLANAISGGVARWCDEAKCDVTIVTLAGSPSVRTYWDCGFRTAEEAFADRRYERDGSLRSRTHENALIHDPAEAAKQALQIVERGTVIAHDGSEVVVKAQTICIHGDTPRAAQIAEGVANALRRAGVELGAPDPPKK